MSDQSSFGDSAQKLARNPLGILALFLLLVYGVAGLVFGVAARTLTSQERQPLIWFLVVFPVLVLLLFAWLVTRHHTKLYAPTDFADNEGFFRALTVHERRERLEREVAVIESDAPVAESASPSSVGLPSTAAMRADLRYRVIVAEDLAIRELETEFDRPILRQVSVGADRGVDGVFTLQDRQVAVEIKYLRTLKNAVRVASEGVATANSLATAIRNAMPVTLLIAVVVDMDDTNAIERVRSMLTAHLPVSIKLRVYDFADLKRKFGVEPPNSR